MTFSCVITRTMLPPSSFEQRTWLFCDWLDQPLSLSDGSARIWSYNNRTGTRACRVWNDHMLSISSPSYGAGDGNRTRILSLEGWCLTTRPRPQKHDQNMAPGMIRQHPPRPGTVGHPKILIYPCFQGVLALDQRGCAACTSYFVSLPFVCAHASSLLIWLCSHVLILLF